MSIKNLTYKIERVIKNPRLVYDLIILKIKEVLLWNYYYSYLPSPKVKSFLINSPSNPETEVLVAELKKRNIKIVDLKIDVGDFKRYLEIAEYSKFESYYKGGKASNFLEKALEHYLAAKVLELSASDVYIDVACSDSPVYYIYHKLYGCKTYRQDLIFPKGLNGNVIGSNACEMPILNGFSTKIALHCSFEQFEQDSDIKFIKEANRVLKEQGKLCILPLYLSDEHAILTDPVTLPLGGINFDKNAKLYCIKNWGVRFARFYDVSHFFSRILNNSNMLLTIYLVKNAKEINPTCHIRFIALFEKKNKRDIK